MGVTAQQVAIRSQWQYPTSRSATHGKGGTAMHRIAFVRLLLVSTATMVAAAAHKAKAEVPAASPLALRSTVEDGYRVEEGFLRTKINDRLVLLQALIVKKTDEAGKLPIMLFTHGTIASPKGRQEMTPRGVKDANLRMVRDYARRGWLGVFVLRRGYGQSDGPAHIVSVKCDTAHPTYQDFINADADVGSHIGLHRSARGC